MILPIRARCLLCTSSPARVTVITPHLETRKHLEEGEMVWTFSGSYEYEYLISVFESLSGEGEKWPVSFLRYTIDTPHTYHTCPEPDFGGGPLIHSSSAVSALLVMGAVGFLTRVPMKHKWSSSLVEWGLLTSLQAWHPQSCKEN